ncbi:recombinase family protein [Chloroflexota bacterium]
MQEIYRAVHRNNGRGLMKTAAIYCRVSTEDQEREGSSLQSQLTACKALAGEKGYEVSDDYIIQEVCSGLTLDRPDLTKLRGLFGSGEVCAVVIYSSDRFSRDGYDFITLIRDCQIAGIELLCVTEPIEDGQVGELLSYVRGWASRMEAEKIKERTMRGIRARVEGGRLPGGGKARLYGYTYVPGKGVGEGIRYVNEEEAHWVKEIYRWFVEEGQTLNGIIYRLRSLGVSTPSGNRYWCKAAIHKILKRVAYTGKTYAFTQRRIEPQAQKKPGNKRKTTKVIARPKEDWVEIPDATPPIISEILFNQAQAKLQRNRDLSSRNSKEQYLLSGYVFCRFCGRRYYGGSATRLSKKTPEQKYYYRYYRCPKNFKIVSPTTCANRGWDANHLENIVWNKIEELLCSPEIVLKAVEAQQSEIVRTNTCLAELDAIETYINQAETEKDRVWKAFELTGDQVKFSTEVKDVTNRIEELGNRREDIKKRLEMSQQTEINMDGIKEFCELASTNLANFTYEEKRLALEALQIKVFVNNQQVEIEGCIPEADLSIESTTV